MYQITKDTRVGLSYRSKIKFDLEGDKTQTGQATRSIYADLTMPDTASLALRHQFNDKWAALADFTWTGWSKLQKLEPVYSDGSRAVAPAALQLQGYLPRRFGCHLPIERSVDVANGRRLR